MSRSGGKKKTVSAGDHKGLVKHDLTKPTREKLTPTPVPKSIQEDRFAVEFSGLWEIGKTRAAALFPKPAMFDTEDKGYREMVKVGRKDHYFGMHTMADFRDWVILMCREPEVKTLIVDSGSDLSDMAMQEYLTETGKDAVYPVILWAKVYGKVDELIHLVRRSGRYLVATSRLKDEWRGGSTDGQRTGKQIRSGYKKFPYQFDMMVLLQWGLTLGKGAGIRVLHEDRVFGKVIKNSFWKARAGGQKKPWLFDVSFEGIKNELLNPWPHGHLVPSERDLKIEEEVDQWVMEQERRERQERQAV